MNLHHPQHWLLHVALVFIVGCLFFAAAPATQATDDAAANVREVEFFEKKIRPLLSTHCYSCHSRDAKTVHGGLLLDSSAALVAGGDSGPAVVTGHPEKSLLVAAVQYEGDIQMPPKGRLSEPEIQLLTDWVRRGAVFPVSADATEQRQGKIDFAQGREFWSFQPLKKHALPEIRDRKWPQERIDFFLLSKMEAKSLAPAPSAVPETLLRRLTFDLTGLPPTPEQLESFLNRDIDAAWTDEVERLLASPHFGERWARTWLDMARYTDKTASWLNSTGQAHLYRDWVVEALNQDMPFDDFVRRQLATDMMSSTGPADIPALGFLGLSPNYWKELKLPAEIIKVIVADEWEERVDVVSRTFLGLTVACARCHDHKFDPISSDDYYAMAGVFASCRIGERPTISEDLYRPVKLARTEVQALEKKKADLQKTKPVPVEQIADLTKQIDAIQASTPHYDAPMATGLLEESLYIIRAGQRADQGTKLDYRPGPQNLARFIRGNPNRPGDVVPRRFLTVLSTGTPAPFTNGSGRLELANSIVKDAAPLAARVIVNRIWGHYFGTGLVSTPSNFGRLGERPSHPMLLDDLASGLIENGWSLKWLHRKIVMSAAYRQSSIADEERRTEDPANRLLTRMSPKRLHFEQWRDAILSAAGTLDFTVGGASQDLAEAGNHRRTIYATVHRRDMSNVLLSHDFPDPTSHSPYRSTTTTPLQGLYALNGPLLQKQTDTMVRRLTMAVPDDRARIGLAYRLLFARSATSSEEEIGLEFLGDSEATERSERWQQYIHALLASSEMQFLN